MSSRSLILSANDTADELARRDAHQNSLTPRFPQYSLRNLCLLVTLVVTSPVFNAADTSHLVLHCKLQTLRRSLFGDFFSIISPLVQALGSCRLLGLYGLFLSCPHLLAEIGSTATFVICIKPWQNILGLTKKVFHLTFTSEREHGEKRVESTVSEGRFQGGKGGQARRAFLEQVEGNMSE